MQGDDERRARPTRREVMAAAGASALALTAGSGLRRSSRPWRRGVVFDDRSGAGRRRPGDPGIAGVMVSNGRDVVRTDADGRWRLPVADGDSVFVIKPPHWSAPVGPGGVPQFSYLHQPDGSPKDLRYHHAGVSPTATLPRSIDFPLRRRRQKPRASRPCCSPTRSPPMTPSSATCATTSSPASPVCGAAFAINHGDVVFDDLSLYPRYLQMIGATGMPWHHCPGNHDINSEAPRRPLLARDLEARVRPAPLRLPARRRHLHRAR